MCAITLPSLICFITISIMLGIFLFACYIVVLLIVLIPIVSYSYKTIIDNFICFYNYSLFHFLFTMHILSYTDYVRLYSSILLILCCGFCYVITLLNWFLPITISFIVYSIMLSFFFILTKLNVVCILCIIYR